MARWHGAVERTIRRSGLPWTMLRPAYFMQNTLMLSGGIRKTGSFALPAADAAVAQIDARDIAAVLVRVVVEAGHKGKAYDLTGPDAITWFEVAEILSAVADRPIAYNPIAPAEFKRQLESFGVPAWLADALNELYAEFRAGGGLEYDRHCPAHHQPGAALLRNLRARPCPNLPLRLRQAQPPSLPGRSLPGIAGRWRARSPWPNPCERRIGRPPRR